MLPSRDLNRCGPSLSLSLSFCFYFCFCFCLCLSCDCDCGWTVENATGPGSSVVCRAKCCLTNICILWILNFLKRSRKKASSHDNNDYMPWATEGSGVPALYMPRFWGPSARCQTFRLAYCLSYQCVDDGKQTEPPPNGQPPTERAGLITYRSWWLGGFQWKGGFGYKIPASCSCNCVVRRGQLQLLHGKKRFNDTSLKYVCYFFIFPWICEMIGDYWLIYFPDLKISVKK